MARTSADYVQQAAHNASLAGYLRTNKPEYLDWAATCLFYAAVHWVNAYLTKNGIAIPRRHRGSDASKKPGRLNIVQQDSTLKVIYSNYRHLDDESRDARYELKKPSENDYDKFLVSHLDTIRTYIQPKVTT